LVVARDTSSKRTFVVVGSARALFIEAVDFSVAIIVDTIAALANAAAQLDWIEHRSASPR
jgi:hypothetical protein